jgi:hypothetical protein
MQMQQEQLEWLRPQRSQRMQRRRMSVWTTPAACPSEPEWTQLLQQMRMTKLLRKQLQGAPSRVHHQQLQQVCPKLELHQQL